MRASTTNYRREQLLAGWKRGAEDEDEHDENHQGGEAQHLRTTMTSATNRGTIGTRRTDTGRGNGEARKTKQKLSFFLFSFRFIVTNLLTNYFRY